MIVWILELEDILNKKKLPIWIAFDYEEIHFWPYCLRTSTLVFIRLDCVPEGVTTIL